MTAWLRQQGYPVNEKRVRRLLRQMGLMAVYPKPHVNPPGTGGQRYPSLLTGVKVNRAAHVWATDITYVRLWQGCVSRGAITDW